MYHRCRSYRSISLPFISLPVVPARRKEKHMKKTDLGKIALILGVIAYIVSPVDFAPGPLDDILITVLTMALPAVKHRIKG